MSVAVAVTTYRRPLALRRSLPQIAALRAPVLVVDDGTPEPAAIENQRLARQHGAAYLRLPANRGLSCAINAGVSYWLADRAIEWIAYFQDDVDVDPWILDACLAVAHPVARPLITGHHSTYHPSDGRCEIAGIDVVLKHSCAAVHMYAHRDYWMDVLPIPTVRLGAPKRVSGRIRGVGSDADWWIVNHAPRSLQKTGRPVICVPHLARTFFWRREDSSWDNLASNGEEAPLSRAALRQWRPM